ncbi:MAG: zinc-ribbon domain-containing protein [Deltaproteobacteria bacterium]|nr:zinc-ribbon domain-containing protein [Deltaproteobacteria bacterium]
MVAVIMRNIVCPSCNSTYRIPESKIPAKGGAAICKKCGGRIVIEGLQKSAPAVASEPPAIPKQSPAPSQERVGLPSDQVLLEDYPDLQVLASPQLDYGEIFKPKKNGRYKSGLNKYKLKVLKSVQGILAKALNQEERVLRIGSGTAYYPAEIFFGNGYLTMMYNRYAILGTNQRALLINIDNRKKRPTNYLFQVPYQDLKKVTMSSLFGRLTFKIMKGKKRTLTGIKGAAARELFRFFKERKEDSAETSSSGGVLENLCPSCFAPLEAGLIKCTRCEREFKEPKKAMFRSLLLPGLGDLYLGHRFLGILEIMGSVLVWAFVILNLLEGNYVILVLLVIFNGIDALLTHHMAKKGYMLA